MKTLKNFIIETRIAESKNLVIQSMIDSDFETYVDQRTGEKYKINYKIQNFIKELKKLKIKFISDYYRGLVLYGKQPFIKSEFRSVGLSFIDASIKPLIKFNTYLDYKSIPKEPIELDAALKFIKSAIKNGSFNF